MKFYAALAIGLFAGLIACTPKAATTADAAAKPVATVNGVAIARETFEYYIKSSTGKTSADLAPEQREVAHPGQVQAPPLPAVQCQPLRYGGLHEALRQRAPGQPVADQKRCRHQPHQDRGLPFQKARIAQQQRGAAEDQYQYRAEQLQRRHAPRAQPFDQCRQHHGGHQHARGEVDSLPAVGEKKGQQRQETEQYLHGLERVSGAGRAIVVPVSQYFELHPANPQLRLIRQAADILRRGGLIAYPTDSCYAFGCHIGDGDALERLRRLRGADRNHHFTLVCRDLAEISRYALVETWQFRMLKAATPGPFTFLLPATRETPRRLQHEKRRTIGIRIPDHAVPRLLIAELGEPIMSSTLLLPGDELPMTEGSEIRARLEHQLDAVLDGGHCGITPTTVVDLAVSPPAIMRQGRGILPGTSV